MALKSGIGGGERRRRLDKDVVESVDDDDAAAVDKPVPASTLLLPVEAKRCKRDFFQEEEFLWGFCDDDPICRRHDFTQSTWKQRWQSGRLKGVFGNFGKFEKMVYDFEKNGLRF
jgi:hypothetical protein